MVSREFGNDMLSRILSRAELNDYFQAKYSLDTTDLIILDSNHVGYCSVIEVALR
jgi:hypothetical protein